MAGSRQAQKDGALMGQGWRRRGAPCAVYASQRPAAAAAAAAAPACTQAAAGGRRAITRGLAGVQAGLGAARTRRVTARHHTGDARRSGRQCPAPGSAPPVSTQHTGRHSQQLTTMMSEKARPWNGSMQPLRRFCPCPHMAARRARRGGRRSAAAGHPAARAPPLRAQPAACEARGSAKHPARLTGGSQQASGSPKMFSQRPTSLEPPLSAAAAACRA